jgi:cytosine/adenosine deaminase-related metal-dependent hydrolase
VHAPQYPQLGKALHVPLDVWLRRYTFPLEARYADLAFARRAYEALVGDLLANGTTTAVYFATIHQEATRLLADICLEKGQRAAPRVSKWEAHRRRRDRRLNLRIVSTSAPQGVLRDSFPGGAMG